MKKILVTVLGLVIFCATTYGCYWLAKTVSYSLFYEDMVRETIREMVNAASLN